MSGRIPLNSENDTGGIPKMSRMQAMQAQFQQKQNQEKEAKLLQMLDNQQQKLLQHTNGLLNKYNNNVPSTNGALSPGPLPPGKVRQMFEERRKGGGITSASSTTPGKGVDKSYPLDPLVTPPPRAKPPSTSSLRSHHSDPPLKKNTSAPPLPTIQRPSNLGSSSKPITPPQSSGGPPLSTSTGYQQSQQRTTPSPSKAPYRVTKLSPSSTVNKSVKSPTLSAGSSLASSAGSGGLRGSPSSGVNLPPVANTTKYSDYASELERREATLSHKLRGLDINGSPPPPPVAPSRSKPKARPAPAAATTSKPSLSNPVPRPLKVQISPAPAKPKVSTPTRSISAPTVKPVVVKKTTKPPRPKGSPPPGLDECKMCGRFFAPDRIAKHEAICKKVKTKKRKTFDPTKMRMQGTEAEPYIRVVSAKPPPNKNQNQQQAKKKADWRKKHEEFIATIRAAKEYQAHVAKGGDPNDIPMPPPSENSDYVQCPYCNRKFSEGAADRHIPKCKNIKSNKRP